MTILIDNGHGQGNVNCSPDQTLWEWKYAREIANIIYNKLVAEGYDCRLVTPEETDIKLSTRCDRVNKVCSEVGAGNVLLVSIHNDACPKKHEDGWENARGWSAWVYRNAGQGSIKLANCLFDAAAAEGLKTRQQYFDKKYWTAGYYILKHTQCPAVLTENLFQNNKEDVKFLLTDEGKQKIANLHIKGIKKYLKK